MAGENLGELFVDIRARLDKLDGDLRTAQGRMQQWGQKLGAIGSTLTRGVTLPLVALGTAAVNASLTFNKAMSNVATLIPGNVERVQELKTAVQDMSMALGQSTEDLAAGLYQVISAFGDTADSVAVLETNAKAAVAGIATTTDAINLTSAVTKAYGDTSAEAVKQVADLALMTVRLGQTTFPELAASIGRVTPLAKEMAVSQQELFAVMATGTGVTGGAAEVSTQLRGVLQSLMAPTADMARLLGEMGVASGQAAVQQYGLQGVIERIVAAAEASGQPLQKFISQIEGQTLALALAGPQADALTQKLGQMQGPLNTLEEAFAAATGGVNAMGHAYDRLKRVGLVFLQEVGDAMVEALDPETMAEFTRSVTELVQEFGSWDKATKLLVLKLMALTMAAGPVLNLLSGILRIAGPLAVGLKFLGGALAGIPGAALYAVGALKAFEIGAGLAGSSAADAMENIKNALRPALDSVRSACNAIESVFRSLASSAIGSAQALYNGVRSWLTGRWGAVVDGVQNAVNRIKSAFRGLYQSVVGGSYVPEMVEGVAHWMQQLGSWAMVGPARNAIEQTQEAFEQFRDNVVRTVSQLGTEMRVAAASAKLWPEFDRDAASAQALESAIVSLLRQGMDSQDPVIQSLNARLMEYRRRLEEARQATEALEEAQRRAEEAARAYVPRTQSMAESLLEVGEAAEIAAARLRVQEAAAALTQQLSERVQAAVQEARLGGLSSNERLLAELQSIRPEPDQAPAIAQLTAAVADLVAQEHALAAAEQERARATQEQERATAQATQAEILRREAMQRLGMATELAVEDHERFIASLREAASRAIPAVAAELTTLADRLEEIGVVAERQAAPTIRSLADVAAAAFTGMQVSAQDAIGAIVNSLDKLGVKSNSVFGRLLGAAGAFVAGGGGPFGIIAGIGKLFGLAEGGTIRSSGLALVGERGPEVVNLPRGAQVTPMPAAVGAGTQQTIIVQLDGRIIARATAENLPAVLRLHGAAR